MGKINDCANHCFPMFREKVRVVGFRQELHTNAASSQVGKHLVELPLIDEIRPPAGVNEQTANPTPDEQ